MKLKIKNLELENRIIVGPMAGVSNQSFRMVMKEFGAGLIVSEMISDKAIYYNNKKTIKMCQVSDEEKPMALQLFGYDIDTMVSSAVYMDKYTNCDVIDINMGCPVNKVVKNNGGSALMKEPEHACELIRAIKEKVDKPVTVKLRAGWDNQHINVVEMSAMLEKAGVDMITVHPRTRTEFYAGHSNWDLIRQVKEVCHNVPIIGNGDIRKLEDMIEMEKLTHCDGFMVSRGCLGNPWLILQMIHYDDYKEILEKPDYNERINQCLKHGLKLVELKGERSAIKEMRGHACWYIDGLPKANKVKAMINFMDTKVQFVEILEQFRKAIALDNFEYFENE